MRHISTPSTPSWQMRVGVLGETVLDEADIAQCIHVILTTPRGSVPLDNAFGADCWRWLDAPLAVARRRIVRAAWEALEAYEPRAAIQSIEADATANGRFHLTIDWQPTSNSVAIVSNSSTVHSENVQTESVHSKSVQSGAVRTGVML